MHQFVAGRRARNSLPAGGAFGGISAGESIRHMAFFEDLRVAQEGLGSLGFWALQVYRLGHLRYRFQSRLVRYPLGGLHLVLAKLAEMSCGVTIGVSAQIGRRLVIEHSGAIVVHGNAVIGDDCIIRQGVTIGNQRMDRPFDAPRIGNRVNIGAGAKILGAVHVGDDVDIGANAVVITDVPAGALAVGVPARIVLRRKPHESAA
jgi:serine O-acetyltransferase